MKATLKFSTYSLAKEFALEWSFYSKRGYNLSADKGDETTLTLFNITNEDKSWIDGTINHINA